MRLDPGRKLELLSTSRRPDLLRELRLTDVSRASFQTALIQIRRHPVKTNKTHVLSADERSAPSCRLCSRF